MARIGSRPEDTTKALLAHAQRVIVHRADRRTALELGEDLRNRLGPDHADRFENLLGIALAAIELVDLRRRRDRLVARGDMVKAQPLGARLATAEQTILDLIEVLAAPVVTAEQKVHELLAHARGAKGLTASARADALALDMVVHLRRAWAAGYHTSNELCEHLNAAGILYKAPFAGSHLCGESPWSLTRMEALRSRLRCLGVNWQESPSERPARVVRTRTRTWPPSHPQEAAATADLVFASMPRSGSAGGGSMSTTERLPNPRSDEPWWTSDPMWSGAYPGEMFDSFAWGHARQVLYGTDDGSDPQKFYEQYTAELLPEQVEFINLRMQLAEKYLRAGRSVKAYREACIFTLAHAVRKASPPYHEWDRLLLQLPDTAAIFAVVQDCRAGGPH